MSGPKSSRYTLTAEQRQRLVQQVAVERNKSTLAHLLVKLKQHKDFYREHAGRATPPPELAETLSAIHDCLLAKVCHSKPLDEVYRQSEACVKTASRLLTTLEEGRRERRAQVESSINRDIAQGSGATLDQVLQERTVTHDKCRKILSDIAREAVSTGTVLAARSGLMQLKILSRDYLKFFFATTVLPLKRKHQEELRQYTAEKEEFDLLRLRYADACDELDRSHSEYDWTPTAKAELEILLEKANQALLRQSEESYIRHALDDVMFQMGYDLIGTRDVKKRTGARFHHVLYHFEDNTAIDVTYDANGQISMELGGLTEEDRLPADHEVHKLCTSMEDFCSVFPMIEQKLQSRGIRVSERLRHLPPTADVAQMINLNDYDVSESSDRYTAAPAELHENQYLMKEEDNDG